jgi:hypothetical protein
MFSVATGHEHPNQKVMIDSYRYLLEQMGRTQDEASAAIRAPLGEAAGGRG